MNADLKWLAENETEWNGTHGYIGKRDQGAYWMHVPMQRECFTQSEWQAARDELENPFSSPEEEDVWKQMSEKELSKYHVLINGKLTDVYDILVAYGVTNPADAHAIKKMLCPGQRGAKDGIQDRREAIASLQRAIELEGGR